jgi:hypothetical protein
MIFPSINGHLDKQLLYAETEVTNNGASDNEKTVMENMDRQGSRNQGEDKIEAYSPYDVQSVGAEFFRKPAELKLVWYVVALNLKHLVITRCANFENYCVIQDFDLEHLYTRGVIDFGVKCASYSFHGKAK